MAQVEPKDIYSSSRTQLAARTYQGYKGDVDNHIKPYLGKLKLRTLEPVAVQQWQNRLEREKSAPVAKNASGTLSTALTKAVAWRCLSRSPYAKGAVVSVSLPERDADYWEPSEARRFITALTTTAHPYYIAYYLTLNLGLRLGELRGLEWEDVVYLRNRATGQLEPHLHVQRRAMSDRLIPGFTERLKTKTSNRFIPLPDNCLNLLASHRQMQYSYPDLGLGTIVTNTLGGMPSNGTIRDTFYALCREAGVRKIKFHGLRHTAGSL